MKPYRAFLHACAAALVAACGNDGGPAPAPPLLIVTPQAVSLPAGAHSAVAASVIGAAAGIAVTFQWRVRDSSLVVIDSLGQGGSVAHLRRVAPGDTVVTVAVPSLGPSGDIPVVASP
jgi:hypothetical protein